MKLLILDPDEYYHQQFARVLSDDFEMFSAKDSGGAKKLLAEKIPDVVVSELLLEDGPSFSLISALRSSGKTMPVIVFSQIANLEDIQETLGMGVSGYFVKGRDTVSDVHQLLLTLNS